MKTKPKMIRVLSKNEIAAKKNNKRGNAWRNHKDIFSNSKVITKKESKMKDDHYMSELTEDENEDIDKILKEGILLDAIQEIKRAFYTIKDALTQIDRVIK